MEPIYFNPQTDKRPTGGYCSGDKVRIPAGTSVTSMNPSRRGWISKRAQVVRVDHELFGRYVSVSEALGEYRQDLAKRGYDLSTLETWKRDNSPEFYRMMVLINQPSIRWAGSGGYWCEVLASSVEKVTL